MVSLIVPRGEGAILTVTQNGYGKRTAAEEYPTKSRATQGVISIKVTERNGSVVGAVQVDDCDQIMMITDAGTLVRTRVSEVSIVGRNTQGVILSRLMTKRWMPSTAARRKATKISRRKRILTMTSPKTKSNSLR